MSPVNALRTAFKFAPLFGGLLVRFGGSNIVVAVFNIAMLIREFFAEGKKFESLDDVVVSVIEEVPQAIIDRYQYGYIKEGILLIAQAMEAFHKGKEAIKTNDV
jgi:hypothetical protein